MFFITSIAFYHLRTTGDHRCFGYYSTLEKATEAVLENRCDIQECLYNYVVIEKIGPGIHYTPDEEFWFSWNAVKGQWEVAEKPEWSNQMINWAIG